MAIDSKAKRFSILSIGSPLHYVLPIADGSFSQEDRQHFLDLYSSVLTIIEKTGSVFWLLPAHEGNWNLACLPKTYTLPEQNKSWSVTQKRL